MVSRSGIGIDGDDLDAIERQRRPARGHNRPLLGEDHLRLRRREDMAELAVIAAHQRIGDGDRRHRHARLHRAQHHRRVRDGIAGQDHQRRIRRPCRASSIACAMALAACIGLAIGDEAPVAESCRRASGVRSRDEIALGVLGGPFLEQMRDRSAASSPSG